MILELLEKGKHVEDTKAAKKVYCGQCKNCMGNISEKLYFGDYNTKIVNNSPKTPMSSCRVKSEIEFKTVTIDNPIRKETHRTATIVKLADCMEVNANNDCPDYEYNGYTYTR